MDVFDFHKMSEVFDRHIFQCQCLGQDCPGSGTVFPNQKTFGCQVFQAVNRVFKRMMSEVFDRHIFQCQCLGQDCPGSGTVFPNQKTFGCQVFQAVNRVFKRMVSRGNSNVFFCFVDTCFVMIPAKISFHNCKIDRSSAEATAMYSSAL